ncbi:MAG: hypothetical protein LBS32_00810 [Clostridiales Family XIII bacterium]|jgi:predicted ribosomally synthesized peptide with SipW-like signal peptide|nr:hypothetical protein [Clostridiales Family XIII bacterium]
MTLTKTLKTKLLLGILAAALSLSLAIGGTLMFFSDDSGPATNVVTLDNAEIQLWESDGSSGAQQIGDSYDAEDQIEGYTYKDGAFSGIDFGEVVPGATLGKEPYVVNSGDIPVYVYVDGSITVKSADGAEVDYDELSDEVKTQIAAILATVGGDDLGSNEYAKWVGTETAVVDGAITGTYYLVDATGALYALPAGDPTPNIFESVTIPFETVDNTLSGYEITLTLTAYAAQSENNTATDIDDLKALFDTVAE